MKIARCMTCDQIMKELTLSVWCESCNLFGDKAPIFEGTQQCQTWELHTWMVKPYWRRVAPYEKRRRH